MNNLFVKAVVRSLFSFTSRRRALKQAAAMAEKYAVLSQGITDDLGCVCVEVPPMPGVDEDMRRWSFFMILEHNTIVNRSITATVCQLAMGEPLHDSAKIDFKYDVMPSLSAGHEQLEAFQHSVQAHIKAVSGLDNLRGTKTTGHPIFGNFDSHKWNCMFSFHLRIHYPQAAHVIQIINAKH